MAENKKSVLLYRDLIYTVEKLNDVTAGKLFKHYLRYINDLDPETDDPIVDIVFEPIKQDLKRDLKKWNEKIEVKSNSGQLGNLKRWNIDLYEDVVNYRKTLNESIIIAKHRKATKDIANIAVKDTVTVNVTDTVTVKANVKDKNSITNILLSKIKISDLTEKEKKYFDISVLFQKLFIKNLEEKNSPTKNQQNAKFGNYVTPIRLMIENDEVTHEQFRIVYDYLGSIEGEFWKPNILSTKKLREKFQTLILQSQKIHTNGQQERTKYTGKSEVRYSDDFKRKIADRLRA